MNEERVGFTHLQTTPLSTVYLLFKRLCDGGRLSFTGTADIHRPALTEALTASQHGALGDQRHLVEAAHEHDEGSRSKIKWKHLCGHVLYLIASDFYTVEDLFKK